MAEFQTVVKHPVTLFTVTGKLLRLNGNPANRPVSPCYSGGYPVLTGIFDGLH